MRVSYIQRFRWTAYNNRTARRLFFNSDFFGQGINVKIPKMMFLHGVFSMYKYIIYINLTLILCIISIYNIYAISS